MNSFAQDFRNGLRALRRRPGFGAMVAVTLALGIGSATAILGITYQVLLKPLPYPDPDRLVMVTGADLKGEEHGYSVSAPLFREWQERNQVFVGLSPIWYREFVLTGEGEPANLRGVSVSWDFFSHVLGVPLLRGPGFGPDDSSGAPNLAVISENLWRGRFGQDPNIVGRRIRLAGKTYEVTGVLASDQVYPQNYDIWTPAVFPASFDWDTSFLVGLGRVRPGVSLEQASQSLKALSQQLAEDLAEARQIGIHLRPLQELLVAGIRQGLLMLLLSVGMLLGISCVNVANLLLARGAFREKEMAIRTALGAKPGRIAQQLMAECLALSLLGGILGLFVAAAVQQGFLRLSQSMELGRIQAVEFNFQILAAAFGLSLLTALLFGTVPAWHASKPQLVSGLASGNRGSAGPSGRSTLWLERGLAFLETALALVLLAATCLLTRSFINVVSEDIGFDPESILTAELSLPEYRYPTSVQQREFAVRLSEAVGAVSSFRGWAVANAMPFGSRSFGRSFSIPDKQVQKSALYFAVSPDYFSVLGQPILKGRAFSAEERERAPRAVIVSDSFARTYYEGENPLGRTINFFGESTIVGVVGDVRSTSFTFDPRPTLYVPIDQVPGSTVYVLAKTSGPPLAMADALRSQIYSVDSEQPVAQLSTLATRMEQTLLKRRLYLTITGAFTLAALLLAAIGVYGVISHNVSQRLHEIGVRIALGATRGRILRMILGWSLLTAALGVAVGIVGTLAVGQVLKSFLYQVSPSDGLTLAAVSLVLVGVSLAASYLPARRASRVDPASLLRTQ